MLNADTILFLLAILPVIALMIFVYRKDRYEKEPIGMLLRALLAGAVATLPASGMEMLIQGFAPSQQLPILNGLYTGFVEAGFSEELWKLAMLSLVVWRSRHFDEYFDGIVYATFVSLGFAGLENIMYVFGQDTFAGAVATGSVRAVMSVPGHFLFGVAMGYYFALAKFRPAERKRNLCLALLVPTLLHGTFDALLMIPDNFGEHGGIISSVLFIAFLYFDIRLWKVGMQRLEKMQQYSSQQADETLHDPHATDHSADTPFHHQDTNHTDTSPRPHSDTLEDIDWNV